MADIRVQYLHFLQIEKQANEVNITPAEISLLLDKLKKLMANAVLLDQRFIALNKETFYLSELKKENELRDGKMGVLYNRLARRRG